MDSAQMVEATGSSAAKLESAPSQNPIWDPSGGLAGSEEANCLVWMGLQPLAGRDFE